MDEISPAELWGMSTAYFIIAKNKAPAQSAAILLYDNLTLIKTMFLQIST